MVIVVVPPAPIQALSLLVGKVPPQLDAIDQSPDCTCQVYEAAFADADVRLKIPRRAALTKGLANETQPGT
jgi:hypothetical protein